MTRARLLYVEDEPGLALTVGDRLRAEGYELSIASGGEEGLALADARPPFDLILLDVMLPGIDGFEVCRRLRRAGVETPILMLTARATVGDRVQGLRQGADDYLCKPFDPSELSARIDALLRRVARPAAIEGPVRFGDVEVDLAGMQVRVRGEPIELAALEFQLLRFFLQREGQVLTRDEILRAVWGFQRPPRTRTVDVHVTWLRDKLEPDRAHPRYIRTVRGVGYRFSSGSPDDGGSG